MSAKPRFVFDTNAIISAVLISGISIVTPRDFLDEVWKEQGKEPS